MLGFNKFIQAEDAIGVVELVLILVVIVGLVFIFQKQLTHLLKEIFQNVFEDVGELY